MASLAGTGGSFTSRDGRLEDIESVPIGGYLSDAIQPIKRIPEVYQEQVESGMDLMGSDSLLDKGLGTLQYVSAPITAPFEALREEPIKDALISFGVDPDTARNASMIVGMGLDVALPATWAKMGLDFPREIGTILGGLYNPGKFSGNAPNYLKGYYGGDQAQKAAVGTGALKTIANTIKQYISPQASANFNVAGLTVGAQKIVADAMDEMKQLENLYKSSGGKLSDSDMGRYSELGKVVSGQIGYNLLIGKQGKANIPLIDKWKDAVYHRIENFTPDQFKSIREKGTEIGKQASDKTMEEAYDIITNTWKSRFTKSPLDEKTLMAVKKNRGPKSTGVHDLDVITSEQGKLLDAVLTANDGNFSSVSALESALKSAAKTADGKKYNVIKTTDDGVWIQVSGYRGSGFVEGGTNAIIKVSPDRKYTIFTSDEHDMMGIVPPGYDRLVTVLPPWGVDKFAKVRKKGVRHPRSKVAEAKAYLKSVKKEPKPKGEKSTTPRIRESLPAKLTNAQRKVAEEMAGYKAPMGAGEYGRFAARRAAPIGAGGLLYYDED